MLFSSSHHYRNYVLASALVMPIPALAMEPAPRILYGQFDTLEIRDADEGQLFAWHGKVSYGGDTQRAFIASEGERLYKPSHADDSAHTLNADTTLGWQHALSAYWDGQLSVRRDWQPDDPNRDWFGIGLHGTAPYFIDIDANLYLGEHGLSELQIEAEYELRLGQKLHLAPSLEVSVYGKDDTELGIGDGLNKLESGLRLRYEIRREFAPYVGVHWEKHYGDSARWREAEGEASEEASWVAGVKIWF